MAEDGKTKRKPVSDRDVRHHILRKLREALPKIREAEEARKKGAGGPVRLKTARAAAVGQGGAIDGGKLNLLGRGTRRSYHW